MRLNEFDVGRAIGFVFFTAIDVAIGFVITDEKTIIRAIGMGDAQGSFRTVIIVDAVFNATVAALKDQAVLPVITIVGRAAFGSDALLIGFAAAVTAGQRKAARGDETHA